jgi:MFS family permease
MVFFAIFELGSLICGVANSSKMLIVGRAIAGIGSSGILNGAFTIIAACVPLVKRPGTFHWLVYNYSIVNIVPALIGSMMGGKLTPIPCHQLYIYSSSSFAAWSGHWTFGWRSTNAIYNLEMV